MSTQLIRDLITGLSAKREHHSLRINWGQVFSVRGGIQRDAENFLKELQKNFRIEYPRSIPKVNYEANFSRLVNLASVIGLTVPIDFFKVKNFAEIQLSGFRMKRVNSTHIIRLHDVFPLTNPEWFRLRSRVLFRRSINAAVKSGNATFVCNSNFTLNQLKLIFPKETYRSYVLPCSYELDAKLPCLNCKGCSEIARNQNNFVIMVGTIEPRKNYSFLLSVLEDINFKVIIVGRYGWRQRKIKRLLQNFESSGKLKWLDQCCDGALHGLYKSAGLFLSTSIEEGYNISALEANSLGLKLLLKDNSVHRENYSDTAEFFTSEKQMISLIEKLMN